MTELETLELFGGDVIVSAPGVPVGVGVGVRVPVGVAVGVRVGVAVGLPVGVGVGVRVGVGVGAPFRTVTEMEAVAVTAPVVCRCAVTVRVCGPLETVVEFQFIRW